MDAELEPESEQLDDQNDAEVATSSTIVSNDSSKQEQQAAVASGKVDESAPEKVELVVIE